MKLFSIENMFRVLSLTQQQKLFTVQIYSYFSIAHVQINVSDATKKSIIAPLTI